MTNCECSESGWCERHKCKKTAHWVHLCQTRPDYFALWEQGKGPGQALLIENSKSNSLSVLGPGTQLKKMLGCCNFKHANILDQWGCDGCLDKIEEVIILLRDNPKTQIYTDSQARRLILLAIQTSCPKNTKNSKIGV